MPSEHIQYTFFRVLAITIYGWYFGSDEGRKEIKPIMQETGKCLLHSDAVFLNQVMFLPRIYV